MERFQNVFLFDWFLLEFSLVFVAVVLVFVFSLVFWIMIIDNFLIIAFFLYDNFLLFLLLFKIIIDIFIIFLYFRVFFHIFLIILPYIIAIFRIFSVIYQGKLPRRKYITTYPMLSKLSGLMSRWRNNLEWRYSPMKYRRGFQYSSIYQRNS